MNAQTYIVPMRRWERGWELRIVCGDEEIGVTQSHTLSGAERMVRDYLALDGLDEDVALEIRPELDSTTGRD